MKNNPLQSGIFMPQRTALRDFPTLSLFLVFLFGVLCDLKAQPGGPGSHWTSGVNFQTNAPAAEDSWAFDATEMPNGDLVLVGYTEYGNSTRVPAWAVVNKYGELLVAKTYPGPVGVLSQIDISADGTYVVMAGFRGAADDDDKDNPNEAKNADAFLVKVKYENGAYSEVWAKSFAVGAGMHVGADATITGQERLTSVDVMADGKIVLNGGFRKGNSGNTENGYTFITVRDANGDKISERVFTDLHGQFTDCKTVNIGGEDCIIFTGFKQMTDEHWQFQIKSNDPEPKFRNSDNADLRGSLYPIRDRDVIIGKLKINDLNDGFIKYFDGKDYPYDGTSGLGWEDSQHPGASTYHGNEGLGSNPNIWDDPDVDECPNKYGPCTPGLSVPGWTFATDGSKNGSPVADAYLSENSTDAGKSIVYKNGYIYVAAEINMLEFSGSLHQKMQHSHWVDGDIDHVGKGVILKNRCPDPTSLGDPITYFSGYRDAYVHLIRLKADGSNTNFRSKNVAHFTGGDFSPTIVIDQTDGNIVLGGNTGDEGVGGCFPEMDDCHSEENMLIKLDIQDVTQDFDIMWQQTHLEYGEGNCVFGLIQTADGGFALIGNNELENGNETFNIVRFTADCQGVAGFDQDGDHTVTSSIESWSPANKPNPYRFRGNVIIPSGKTLKITGLTVEFASTKNTPDHRKSGITVQQGGQLIVNGSSVLKGIDCGGEQMWDGITVLGNPNQPAGLQQGRMSISDNSRIENAVRGAVMGNTAWQLVTKQVPAPGNVIGTSITATYMDNLGMGGGRIISANATFRNCGRGVVWSPQKGVSNGSFLVNTKFEFTGPLVDPLYAFSSDAPTLSRPSASEMGCRLRSVGDVKFINCSFISTAAPGLYPFSRNRPTGIYATDAKFSFTGGAYDPHFKDLYIGIESAALFSSLGTTLHFSGAKCDNVYQGLNVRGTVTPFISGCQFRNIPDKGQPEDGDPSGMHSVGTIGISLTDNQFDSNASFKNSGAHINNSMANGGAKVEYNTFTDMNIANLFDGNNLSLQTHCNTYAGAVGDVSWDVLGPIANQMSNDASYYPDNKFLSACAAPLLDIRSTVPFVYKERFPTMQNMATILQCRTPNVGILFGPANAPNNGCIIEDPCPDPPNCVNLTAKYNASGYALPYRNDLLNAYVRMSPGAVADSLYLPGTTRGITLLTARNFQEDKRILVATYGSLGNYTTAMQYLMQVTGSDTESQDFVLYYSVLLNAGLAGRDAYHLTAAEFAQLAPLMTHSSTAAENVKVLDHVLNGVYHPLKGSPSNGARLGQQTEEEVTAGQLLRLSVYPNPFSDDVQFVAPKGLFITALSITDFSGRLAFERTYTAEESVTWTAEGVADGVLFYRCSLSDGAILHGKLVHSKKH